MVISQPFVIQPEELPVWIRDICSYHSAAGSHKRAGTRRYFSAGARGSAARILIDSSRIRAPTPTILIYLTSVNHFRSNDVKNSPLLTVVFDIEIHATLKMTLAVAGRRSLVAGRSIAARRSPVGRSPRSRLSRPVPVWPLTISVAWRFATDRCRRFALSH